MKTNFHTHSIFCDGNDTPEELVKSAIGKGFSVLGFSSHSFFPLDRGYCLEKETEYKTEISRLKEKYADKIKIFCGIEQDYFTDIESKGYDYIIGSVHYVLKNNEYIAVDLSSDITHDAVNKYYGGDFDLLSEDYFSLVADVVKKTNADIIGHFDLVSKYSEELGYIQSERYLSAAEKAIKALIPFNKPFEINTGAMARGIKTVPYPSPEILKLIKKYGGKVIITSDCHDKDYLDFGFDKALELAKKVGFEEQDIICMMN